MSDAELERNTQRKQEKYRDHHLRQVESQLRDDHVDIAAFREATNGAAILRLK